MAPLTLHATTVAVDGHGVLIIGASGTGKSALGLHLVSLGARLVADDRTQVTQTDGRLIAKVPPTIEGLIEARYVGLIRTPPAGPTPLALVIDLDQTESERLPHPHTYDILDITLPCLWGISSPHFAPAILLYLKGGVGETS